MACSNNMHIAIIGTGYVGLVTGADFACRGIDVTCVDIDIARIEGLQKGTMPFYEPGLPARVAEGVAAGHLGFTTDSAEAMREADVVMCAVGTPTGDDGRSDLTAVFAVADMFAHHAKEGALLINKSTVPVGTADACTARVVAVAPQRRFAVVSNPEFLSQGTAVQDTAHPTRIVVGTDAPWACEILREVNAGFIAEGVPYLEMAARSAEAVKCAANAFLATKISFINEIANFCERAGGDISDVARVLGLDPRIGPHFLRAGIGYGGGCLSKDVRALIASGEDVGYAFRLLPAIEEVNDTQKYYFYNKFADALGGVQGKTVAVWGLSFKPGTDDMRNAPSIPFIQRLLDEGATVKAFDPAAMDRARTVLGERVTFTMSALGAAEGADAVVLLTEWDEFREVNFSELAAALSGRVVADGRGIWRHRVLPASLYYIAVGVGK